MQLTPQPYTLPHFPRQLNLVMLTHDDNTSVRTFRVMGSATYALTPRQPGQQPLH